MHALSRDDRAGGHGPAGGLPDTPDRPGPGPYEGKIGRPFAWTAGKTLFKWYDSIGVDEETFRDRVYMAAVCRCFPGKNPKGGDRVPNAQEVAHCGEWMRAEVGIMKPELVIPVGKLAIAQMLHAPRLDDVIGKVHRIRYFGHETDAIPLPHPSGLSTWFKIEPGKTLLGQALALIARHPAWQAVFAPAQNT
ncbi:uracil-DNA glycosylase family protein [Parasulfuritortus cantonensis]|uniref:uracil-DNA glycosylase family protein n=1 Tax=Parasulfuritortus cantonensis TaxID=2528202 RepID=UPI00197EC625|nr:uracil-DNA glycosylase family protein [Parasulfuritortus cantonensis]